MRVSAKGIIFRKTNLKHKSTIEIESEICNKNTIKLKYNKHSKIINIQTI